MSLSESLSDLDPAEAEAARIYRADSSLFHAASQGRLTDFAGREGYQEFANNIEAYGSALDDAISKSVLSGGVTLYSGHASSGWIQGSLSGNIKQFIDLVYRYNGYTSTTISKELAIERFILTQPISNPALLTFNLPPGFHALNLSFDNQGGEFEYLLPRNHSYKIVDSEYFAYDCRHILELILEPV